MEKLEKMLREIREENLYKILGIEKTDDVTIVKRAYKKSARHYHPDKNKEKNTVEIFQQIQKAYEILKDEELKSAYDSILDKKEIKRKRGEILDGERKKFADDLKKREEEHALKTQQEKEENILRRKRYAQEKNFTHQKDDLFSSQPKKKTFEEKLINTGIKIKWSKNLEYVITKETILSYFKEFGVIDEVICKQELSKAFVLFNSESNFNNVMNCITNDKVIQKLFKIKRLNKIKKTDREEEGYDKIKSTYLDSNVLNKIKNMKMQSNIEFMKNQDQEMKKDSLELNKNEAGAKSEDKHFKTDLFNLNLEDFEKKAFEKLRMKTTK